MTKTVLNRIAGLGVALAATLATAFSAAAQPVAQKHWVDGYYVGYERNLYPIANIDFSALTHIMVGRYAPNANGTLDTSCDWDAALCPTWAKSVGAKAHAAGRKAILFLGGAGADAGFIAATRTAVRPTFVANIAKAVKSLNFDGVDIDWEPIRQQDVAPLIALLKDLRTALPGKLITMPITWANKNFPADSAWVGQAAPHLDQVNIMTYGMDGSDWGWAKTWASSALDGETSQLPSSVSSSVEIFLAAGVPAAKLGVGIGFYGQCWTGGVTAPRQSPGQSRIVADDGLMSFAHIMDQYFKPAAHHFDAVAKVPYLGSAAGLGPRRCTYVSYEDEQSIAAKAAYLKSKGLGGAIIWTISQGWRSSTHTNSVLTAAKQILP